MTRDRASATFPAVWTLGLTALSLVAACRFNFDAQAPPVDTPDAAIDAAPDAAIDSPPDPPTLLGCTPQRFPVGATAKYVTAVGTRRGYDVFVVDDAGGVTGYAYRFAMDRLELVPGTGIALPVPAAIGPVGALALEPETGDDVDVVKAVPYAVPAITMPVTGTVVVPLDDQLHRVDGAEAATMNDGIEGGPGTLAGGDQGKVAFAGRGNDGSFGLAQLSRRGVLVPGSGHAVDTGGHTITRPTLVRAAAGYLAVWSDNDSMPHEAVTAAVLDESLVAQAPTTVSVNPDHGSFTPTAAYSASSDRYLFAWMEKPGKDFVKLAMRDGQLRDAPGPIELGQEGTLPVVAAGEPDFLVVWSDPTALPRKRIAAARVAPSGTPMLVGITNTGGDAVSFDLVVHNGQAALVWIERAASGPTLWVDALCM